VRGMIFISLTAIIALKLVGAF